jgi:hypothetical protein
MADLRALVAKQGVLQGITTTDTLVVGNKVDASAGQALSIGDVNATSITLGQSGITTTAPGKVQFNGAVAGIPPVGPGQLLQQSGTLFQNSGYVPGIGQFDTPASFGFFPVQNANFVVNPGDLFGVGNSYRIRMVVRVTGAFNDGLHCMLQRVVIGTGQDGVPGLLDFGSGVLEIYSAVSNTFTAASNFQYFIPYFAAFNGGNGATLQDVSIYLEEV